MEKEIKHISGAAGGYLVGNPHSQGGIKAINKAVGKPLEMEGGEVVITKPAVEDNEKREFEGEMLTNRQILSKINESGGGVSFAEKGAELPTELYCTGKMYKYGGESISDHDILHKISKCGCQHDNKDSYAKGGEVKNKISIVEVEEKLPSYYKDAGLATKRTIKKIKFPFEIINYNPNQVNEKNYFLNTEAIFHDVTTEISKEFKPDFYSDSGSEYMYDDNGVYRKSNHWGWGIASCDWTLDTGNYGMRHLYGNDINKYAQEKSEKGEKIGFAKWSDFKLKSNALPPYYNEIIEGKPIGIATFKFDYFPLIPTKYISDELLDYMATIRTFSKQELEALDSEHKEFVKDNTNEKVYNLEPFAIKKYKKNQPDLPLSQERKDLKLGFEIIKNDIKYVVSNIDENEVELSLYSVKKYEFAKGGKIDNELKKGDVISNQTDDYQNVVEQGDDLLIPGDVDSNNLLSADLDAGNTMFEKGGQVDESTISKRLKDDIYLLVGLQEAKQNKKPSGGYDINLFKASFFNKVKKMDQAEATNVLNFLTQMEEKTNVKPIFSKNHKIWENYIESNDNKNDEFSYKMLGRLKSDNDYFLGNGNRNEKHLWANNVKDQITEMKRLWNSVKIKPEWLSMEDISNYEKEMTTIENNEPIKPKYKEEDYVSYNSGDLDEEMWIGKIIKTIDLGNNYAYRIDAYSANLETPMHETENTNEIYEVSLKPSTKTSFEIHKNDYEQYKELHHRKDIKPFDDDAVIQLAISPENPLSTQLMAHTGDHWNSIDFENLEPTVTGTVVSDQVFRHKGTGKKFITVRKSQEETTYNVAAYKNPYEVNRAIEALLDSKPEGSFFTPNEKDFISYYSGYGGLQKYGTFTDEEIKGLLYEFFTPDEVVKKMWALAYKYGFGAVLKPFVLEPSVGTGNFFKYAPKDAELFANEINKYSKEICNILFPTATIALQPFEKNFIQKNNTVKNKLNHLQKYDIVIGNPPYGSIGNSGKYLQMGETDYTKARNYTEYFITRGLDLLKPEGLLIFVVGAEQYNGGTLFLDSAPSEVKKEIFNKAQLVDAYRLPTKIFERTGVSSEILVFKKY